LRALQRRVGRGCAGGGDRQGAAAVRYRWRMKGMRAMDHDQSDPGDLRELYQEVIFDHNRKPRNFRALAQADQVARGHNPLCGDQLTVYLKLADDRVADVSFEGQGCAISTASASLMTEAVKGRPVAEVEALFRD